MSKLTKTIKGFTGLNDEEKKDFVEFFQKEQEKVEEVEEVEPVEKKVETKVEEVKKEEPKQAFDFETAFKNLEAKFDEKLKVVVEEVKVVKEEKQEAFGVKAQPKTKKDSTEFEDLFAKLSQGQ